MKPPKADLQLVASLLREFVRLASALHGALPRSVLTEVHTNETRLLTVADWLEGRK